MEITEKFKKQLKEEYGIIDLELYLDELMAYQDYVSGNHPQIDEYAWQHINGEE